MVVWAAALTLANGNELWSIQTLPLVFLLSGAGREGHGWGGCIFNGCLIPEFLAVPAERERLKVPLNFAGRSLLLLGRDVLPPGLLLNTRPQACVHLLTSLGGLKMLGQFIWTGVVAARPRCSCCSLFRSEAIVLCELRLVNDVCCVVS